MEQNQAMKGENTRSKQCIFDEQRDILDAENEDLLSAGAHFNFLKLHIMSHFASLIPLFGTPSQWSTDTTEKNHIATFKDTYVSTNLAENYEEQMLRYGIRHDTFIQHELQSNAVLSDDDDDEENDNETSP